MTDADKLEAVEKDVRQSICETYSSDGRCRVEGRIAAADFEWLLGLLGRIRAKERERCASLHESVDPASDAERLDSVPGAGAMGAVIQYRDLIRAGY